MYNFVFFFIYSQQIQKGKSEFFSIRNGALIVGLTLIIHIGFLYAIYRKIFLMGSQGYGGSKSIISLFVIAIFVLSQFYYNKKITNKILERENGELLFTGDIWNNIKMILLCFVPLIIEICLSIKTN